MRSRKPEHAEPDPGDEFQHVNTQLFGIIDPASNRGAPAER